MEPRKAKTLNELPERLHHFGFTIKDQEANRHFFEDILGIPLVATWCERAYNVVVGREIEYCHTFYAMKDGGALAFFQFADQDAYEKLKSLRPEVGHHISFKVSPETYAEIRDRLNANKISIRETDHGYCQSLYVSTPDALKLEFTYDAPEVEQINEMRRKDCHSELKRWLAGDRRPNNEDRHGVTS
jgi:catechol 2,3-dioxygenase-like lactoylglutathione lyase family enzyme